MTMLGKFKKMLTTAGPSGRIRADLVNLFAATAMIAAFSLESLGRAPLIIFFFIIFFTPPLILIAYYVLKHTKFKHLHLKLAKSEVVTNMMLTAFVVVLAFTSLILVLTDQSIAAANKTGSSDSKSWHWLVYNLGIALIVLWQLIAFFSRSAGARKSISFMVGFFFMVVMFLATVLSAVFGVTQLTIAGAVVGLIGLACWMMLELLGILDKESGKIKSYWIKNIFQIIGGFLFAVFSGIVTLEVDDSKDALEQIVEMGPIAIGIFFFGALSTVIGTALGVFFGARHYLKKPRVTPKDSIVENNPLYVRGEEIVKEPVDQEKKSTRVNDEKQKSRRENRGNAHENNPN